MSDVINGVPRELLERVCSKPKACSSIIEVNRWSIDQKLALGELRALLTEQSQASAAQSAHADESGVVKVARDILAILQHPTRSVTAMDMWKLEDALKAHDEAAQSAPAGEREAFELASVDDSFGSLRAFGAEAERRGIEDGDYIDFAARKAWEYFQAGAAWQRTQSAGVPVGWQFYQDGKWCNGDDRIRDHRANTEAAGYPVRDVYAAPVQPAAQESARTVEVEIDGLGCCQLQMSGGKVFMPAVTVRDILRMATAAQDQGEVQRLREALEFYARGDHLMLADPDAWDTCSGEAENWLHDDEGTASVEDGSLAKAALAASTGQEV